jgi:hypothetical protein
MRENRSETAVSPPSNRFETMANEAILVNCEDNFDRLPAVLDLRRHPLLVDALYLLHHGRRERGLV